MKNLLRVYCHPIRIQAENFKNLSDTIIFSILYIKNESLIILDIYI